jgi:hypothetical protein
VCTGLFWLSVWAVGELLWILNLAFGFHKRRGSSWVPGQYYRLKKDRLLGGLVSIGCFSEIRWTLLLWQFSAFYYILFNSDDVISVSCDCYIQPHSCSRSPQCDSHFETRYYLNGHIISTHYILQRKERIIMNTTIIMIHVTQQKKSSYFFELMNPLRLENYFYFILLSTYNIDNFK